MSVQTNGGFVKLGDFVRSGQLIKSESPAIRILGILNTVMPGFNDQTTRDELVQALQNYGGLDEEAIQIFADEIFNDREPKCSVCGDTGWQVKQDIYRNEAGGEITHEYVERCHCEEARKAQESTALEHFDTVNWRDRTFPKFKRSMIRGNPGNKDEIMRAHSFLQKWDKCDSDRAFVILYGTVGNGKTHLATAWLIDQFTRCKQKESWIVRCKVLSNILATLPFEKDADRRAELKQEYNRYLRAACLVIDDLQGLHLANDDSSTIKEFTEFIDYRMRYNLRTIITMNFDLMTEDGSKRLGAFNDVLTSRIYGDGKSQVFAFLAQDKRAEKK